MRVLLPTFDKPSPELDDRLANIVVDRDVARRVFGKQGAGRDLGEHLRDLEQVLPGRDVECGRHDVERLGCAARVSATRHRADSEDTHTIAGLMYR
jgi:hypothetical protein